MPFNSTGSGGNKVVPLYGGAQVSNPAQVILVTATPSTAATSVSIGTIAINPSNNTVYICSSNTGINGSVTWEQMGLSSGTVGFLNGDTGGNIGPTAGVINIIGTANEILVSGSGSTLTLSLINPEIFPGNLTVAGTLTVQGSGTTAIGTSNTATTVTLASGTGNNTVSIANNASGVQTVNVAGGN